MNRLAYILLIFVVIGGCKKDDETSPSTNDELQLQLKFTNDGVPLQFDTIMFANAGGYTTSFSRLQFYISSVQLIKADSSLVEISEYNYVDARVASTQQLRFTLPATGHFIGMKLLLGLDSAHNISNSLPATVENINMAWPDMMGGGYHFMKLEGSYVDSTGTYGYAMHVGKNAYLVNCTISHHFDLNAGLNAKELVMNVNEWFKNPAIYDFNVDGNYSMGVMAAMTKLKNNGTDIFTIQ